MFLLLCLSPYRAFYFDQLNRKCHLLPFDRFSEGAQRERKPNYDLYEKKGKYFFPFEELHSHLTFYFATSSNVYCKCFVLRNSLYLFTVKHKIIPDV